MGHFVLIVTFQVKPEHLQRFNQMIDVNARASAREEPGCRQFDVMRGNDDPCKVVLYEVYDSEEAFKAHGKMSHTQTFLAAAKEMVSSQTAVRLERMVAPAKGA